MYTGIKKKEKYQHKCKIPTKVQVVIEDEIETNGIIRKQLVVKTIDYKADPNIKYTDFEVNNLLAAGINLDTQPTIMHTPNREKLMENAEAANKAIEQIDIINEFERKNNGTEQNQQ